MNSSRRKIAAILEALGVPPSARRPAAPAATPACETLEGRQLLTGGMAGLGLPDMGVADIYGPGQGFGSGHDASSVAGTSVVASAGVAPSAMGYGQLGGSGAAGTQLQSDLDQLRADTQTIHDESLVTPAMTATVNADIKAAKAAETTTPSMAAVAFLKAATKAANAIPGGPTLGQAFQTEVARNVVFLSEGVGTATIDQLDKDEMAVMMASGITATDEATLASDRAAVTADLAKVTPVAMPTTTATPTASASTGMPVVPSTMTPPVGSSAWGANSGSPSGPFGFPGALDATGASVLMSSMRGLGLSPMGGSEWMGGPAGTSPTSTTVGATLTADQMALKLDVEKLQIDGQAVHDKSQVTPAMEAVVREDLATTKGAETTAASSTAEATLQADLKAAQANAGGPTAAQAAQIQADKDAVYASEGVNAKLVAKLDADLAAVKTASGITAADQATLAADQAAVKADQAKVVADAPTITPPTTTTTTTPPATGATTTTPSTAMPTDPGMRPGMDFRFMGGDRGGLNPGGFGFPG